MVHIIYVLSTERLEKGLNNHRRQIFHLLFFVNINMEDPNIRCNQLINQYYRNLCNVVNIQPGNNPNVLPLTGHKATDIIILGKLNDIDLLSVCGTNKYLNDLCNNEFFWMNRTLTKFPFLGTGKEIVMNYIPSGVGWKEYYIWLSDMALLPEYKLEEWAQSNLRLDIQLLLGERNVDSGRGFKNPVTISHNMLQFFRNANLGKIDPRDPNSANLRDSLYSLRSGITTRSILTPLLNIYVTVNNMQKDPTKKQFLTATPEMYQYFQHTFNQLAARPPRFDRNNIAIPPFNPQKFRFNNIQSIIALNINRYMKYDPAYEYPKTDQEELNADQQLISNVLSIYRENIIYV